MCSPVMIDTHRARAGMVHQVPRHRVAEAGPRFPSSWPGAVHPHSIHRAAVTQGARLREAKPRKSFVSSSPAYLLSNQQPTLYETVQHLLTVAIGRLAGLGRKVSM